MAEMMEGYKHEDFDSRYGSKGVTGASLGLGIAGTTLGLLNGGLGLMSGLGAGMNGGWMANHAANYVTKEAFDLQKQVSEKDSVIALLKSESNTEVKIADVYSRLKGDVLEQERLNNARHTEQLVWNAKMEARMAVAESKLDQVMGMTGLYIEASRVTPMPMDRYNSWTAPTA